MGALEQFEFDLAKKKYLEGVEPVTKSLPWIQGFQVEQVIPAIGIPSVAAGLYTAYAQPPEELGGEVTIRIR